MKYDKDLIESIYLLQQSNPALAERMWNRWVQQEEQYPTTKTVNLGYGLDVPDDVFQFIRRHHKAYDKIPAIKTMREKTGWGLKDAKDAVDRMIEQGWLR